MSRDVATVSPEETVASAARLMAERNISCIIVLEGGSVVGILTETDLLKRVVVHQGNQAKIKVAEVMSCPVEGIEEPDLSIFDASLMMEAKGFKHLPVLEDRRLVGIVTQTDLTRALVSYHVYKSVAEIMSRDVATVQCKATVAEAAEIMSSRNISCIVVLQGEKVAGVVTQRDLLKRIVASQQDAAKVRVEEIMSCPVISSPADNSLFSAGRIMERMHVRRLVVMEDDRLCGIVTQTNLFKAAKEEMQEEEERNVSLLEKSEYGIYTFDIDGKTTYVNPAFMKMLGVRHSAELLNQPFLPERFWLNPEERPKFMRELKEMGFIKGKELALRNSEGERVYVALLSMFTRSGSGQINGGQGIIRDITKDKKAEQELIEANKKLKEHDRLKDEFAINVSHELRTPLAIFRNVISNALASATGRLSPKMRKDLKIAEESVDRLGRIVSDLLDISKIESGKMRLNLCPTSIQSIVVEITDSLLAVAQPKGIELKAIMPKEELIVNVDHDRISQILVNLISNAIKFTPEIGGRVNVRVKDLVEEVGVDVEDNGLGIAPNDIDKVFNRFVQVKKYIGPGEHGTGLGLPIAKELVEMHGGRIWVESKPGEGATFCFALPKCSVQECTVPEASLPDSETAGWMDG